MNKLLYKQKLQQPKRTKKNAPRRANPSRRRNTRPNRGPTTGILLSPCAAHYAKAIAEPWSPDAMGACIPKVPARPSRKVSGFTRQTAYAGTQGYGFVAIIPNASNDTVAVVLTTPAYTGTSSALSTSLATTTGIATYNISNLPVSSTSFNASSSTEGNPSTSARIVSVGVTIQYIGALINQGGYYRAYTDPDHNNVVGILSGGLANSSAETSYLPITAKKRNYAISAVDTKEYEYNALDDIWDYYTFSNRKSFNGYDASIGAAPFILEFTTTPGNPFFVEVIEHIEYTGLDHQAALTPSHADATGFEKVAAAAAAIPGLRKNNPESPMSQLMEMALKATVASLKPIAYKALSKGHQALMNGSL